MREMYFRSARTRVPPDRRQINRNLRETSQFFASISFFRVSADKIEVRLYSRDAFVYTRAAFLSRASVLLYLDRFPAHRADISFTILAGDSDPTITSWNAARKSSYTTQLVTIVSYKSDPTRLHSLLAFYHLRFASMRTII